MAAKKKHTTTKKKATSKKAQSELDSLYICMRDAETKRKNLLLSVRDALVMQEEHEKVSEYRREKHALIKEIKQDMESLKKEYDNLKKLLPDVKSVLPATEKELTALEEQIDMLKTDIASDEGGIEMRKEIKKQLKKDEISVKDEVKEPEETPKVQRHKTLKKPNSSKTHHKHERVDRIKNNLSIIESKLKHL